MDLAQACGRNAGLHGGGSRDTGPSGTGPSDAEGFDAATGARRARLVCDGYWASAAERAEVLDLLLALAVLGAADHTLAVAPGREREAADAVAGGVREAAWLLRHRRLLAGVLA